MTGSVEKVRMHLNPFITVSVKGTDKTFLSEITDFYKHA